jgi:hypothetical protein
MSAGSIVIDLLMKTGSFETDTARAAKSLKQLQKEAAAAQAKTIALGVAIGNKIDEFASRAVDALHEMTFGAIDAADHLNDLSKKTGIAVETLGGIGFAAGQAGGDLETAAAGAGKLNRSLAEAAAGIGKTGDAFKAMGIDVKDAAGNTKSADVALVEIANKFATYADGPEKAALAVALFGKAGADMIPLLDDGGTALQENIAYFEKYGGLTTELAEKSDAFNDTLGKLKVQSQGFGNQLANALLPGLQLLADSFLKIKEDGTSANELISAIRAAFEVIAGLGANIAFVLAGMGREIGAIAAQMVALSHLDFKGFHAISESVKEDGVKARKELDEFLAHLFDHTPKVAVAGAGAFVGPLQPKGTAPKLTGDDAGAVLRKQLDGHLKAIADFAQKQRELFDYANKYVEGAYSAGKISLQAYFDDQQYIRDQALAAEVAGYDKEIAALKEFQAKATKEPERLDASNKIAEAQTKRADAIAKAAQTEVLAEQQRQQATQQTTDRYNDLIATMDALKDDDAGAAAIHIAQQVRDATKLVAQAGKDPAVVEQYRAQLEGVAALAEQQKQYNKLLDHTQNTESTIGYDAKISGQTELETLADIRDERARAIVQLREQAAAARELADSLNTDEARKRADELALAVKKATAELDPLAEKLNSVFVDSFANAFEGFIEGTKSAAQAFREFGKAIIQEFAHMAAQAAATKLFGGSGGGGGLGGLFSSFFGGSGGAAGAGDYSSAGLAAAFEGTPAADGMNYVPYDGFRASLHRGEAVVPAKYNPALGNGASGEPLKLTIVNHTSGRIDRATEQRISPTERALIIEEATENVAASFHDPNSRVSRAASRNLNVTRKR